MAITFYYNESKIQIFKIFSGTLDEIIQMHAHIREGYELHLIDSGGGILETEDNRYTLSKNTLYVTGPNIRHKQIPDFEKPMHELCVYLKIPGADSSDTAVRMFASKAFWIGKSNAEVRRIFRQMTEENEKYGPVRKSVLSSLALRLIVEMTKLYFPDGDCLPLPEQAADLNESRSWILDQLMLEDCSSVTLDDFAKHMGVCPRQAERIIKDYYGSTFKKLRYESKMNMAATLLEQEDISVEACSVRCGYSSATAFCTAFRRKFGVTPNDYRKSL